MPTTQLLNKLLTKLRACTCMSSERRTLYRDERHKQIFPKICKLWF